MTVRALTFHSERDTEAFGLALGRSAAPGDVVALYGELGAGKTRLAQSIAAGLGIDGEPVASPTYAILNEHRSGRLPLYHMDAYRIADISELGPIGYDDYLGRADGIMVIEWAGNIEPDLPPCRLSIKLTADASASSRHAEITVSGDRAAILLRQSLAEYDRPASGKPRL